MHTPRADRDSARLELEHHPAAVRQARTFVEEACHAAGVSDVTRETAVLLTSEIVTNAFLHGRSRATLTLSAGENRLRVEVGDDNTRLPHMAEPDREALNGRGLAIVDMLAADWGADAGRHGKVVWFELARPPRR